MRTMGRLVVLISLLLIGCSKDNPILVQSDYGNQSNQGRLRLYITDAPTLLDAVNIVVTRVEVHRAGYDSTSGWVTIDSTTRTHNLLLLTNGASALLGEGSLDAGRYTQIRLIIGEGSTVVVGGISLQLKIPSGMQTGLKLVHQFEIQANTLYELMLDFDASRSIHKDGPGTYILQPVIRVQALQTSGSISGTVNPVSARASISTTVGADTVTSFADTTSGFFKLTPLPAGSPYTLRIVPSDTTYRDSVLTGISVVAKQNTDVGIIVLSPK